MFAAEHVGKSRSTAKGLLASRPRIGTRVEPASNWSLLDPDVLGWLLERKFSPALLMEFTEFRRLGPQRPSKAPTILDLPAVPDQDVPTGSSSCTFPYESKPIR